MAFRADEAAERGTALARRYLLHRGLDLVGRRKSEATLLDIIDECGPVVESYPIWHPLVSNHDEVFPENRPTKRSGYKGLDHNLYFAHGFVTCPYTDGQDVIDSVNKMEPQASACITAEALDVEFYNSGTTAVLVRCEWNTGLELGGTIPPRLAVPLMIEQELKFWRTAQIAERWEDMRPYLLGEPFGARSSLFVTQQTALAIKKAYMAMVESGMFGPLRMG